jgi:uncharacterized protein YbjQ (UPF0145 family)
MAKCDVCGEKISLFGGCQRCAAEKSQKEDEQRQLKREAEQRAEKARKQKEAEREEQIKRVLLTSETAINHGVVERYGFIMVEELKGGLDLGLEKMAEQLLPKLKEKAFNLGANAVVAVRIEAIKIMDVGIGVTEMGKFVFVASGTAVKLSSE